MNDEASKPTRGFTAPVGFVAYIGTKIVSAFHIAVLEPAGTSTVATDLMGNVLTLTQEFMAKHTPIVGGRIVMYKDGYMSFSPAEAFEDAYHLLTDSLDFGDVIRGLHEGRSYARAGWSGRGMFIALQKPSPDSMMTLPYIYMYTAQEEHVPWLASQTDMLASDWVAV
jgi:hypothetical protein